MSTPEPIKEPPTPLPQKPDVPPVEEPTPPEPKKRLEPTRYGDWELNGKCVDF